MADAIGIMEKIKKAAVDAQESTKPVQVYFGKVTAASPLEIRVEQKLKLSERQLILTRSVTDYMTTVDVSWETEHESGGSGAEAYARHGHAILGQKQIKVHNGLAVGEEVILLRQQEGQKFIVLDRIGGGR